MAYYNVVTNHACQNLSMGLGFYRPPPQHKYQNYNERPEGTVIDTLVLHYTVSNFARSYYLLAHADGGRPGPSAHYMINSDGRVDNLVDDADTAWHAGKSYWHVESVNKNSIGIELVNPGSGEQNCFPVANDVRASKEDCVIKFFPDAQINSLLELIKCLCVEHPGISNRNIIGHSDIAPDRKIDPGIAFPWSELYEHGIGLYSYKTMDNPEVLYRYGDNSPFIAQLKSDLQKFGYGYLDESPEFDTNLAYVVRAFHLHHNQRIEAQGADWGDWNSIDQVRLEDLLTQLENDVREEHNERPYNHYVDRSEAETLVTQAQFPDFWEAHGYC